MNRSKRLTQVRQLAVAAVSLLGAGALAGCGVSGSTPSTNFNPTPVLQGQVLAGRNYMVGAKVTVYSTASTGTANSAGNYTGTAKVLGTAVSSGVGAYSIPGLSCSSPDMVYVVAEGGHPYTAGATVTASIDSGLPPNPNSLMMTAIGDCSILSNSQVSAVVTNEASTVAAVEALQHFISLSGTTVNITSSATNYAGTSGVGTTSNRAGLKHAFATAENLADYRSAAFNQVTGSVGFNYGGIVPVNVLNALAYAQYLCTIGGDNLTDAASYPYCTTLFTLATPPGGTKPANSLEAMLNIARNPSNNSAALLTFSLNPIPFSTNASKRSSGQLINDGIYVPALSSFNSVAADFSIGISYPKCYGSNPTVTSTFTFTNSNAVTCSPSATVAPANGTTTGLVYPLFLALDENDNVYVSNPSGGTSAYGSVVALANSGQLLYATATDTSSANALINPRSIATDQKGHVFVVNQSATAGQNYILELNAASGAVVQKIPSAMANVYGLAVDSLGNLWYGSTSTAQQLREAVVNSSGTYTETALSATSTTPLATYQVQVDAGNNIWAIGTGSPSAFYYLPNTGTVTAPTYTAPLRTALLPALGATQGVGVDAAGNGYTATQTSGTATGAIYKATVTGSGATSTLTATQVAPALTPANATRNWMIDGLGAEWYLENPAAGRLVKYVPGATATSGYQPCYSATTFVNSGNFSNTQQLCAAGFNAKIDLAIDSSGNIWVANATGGTVVEMVGVGAPTVPNRSQLKLGVMP